MDNDSNKQSGTDTDGLDLVKKITDAIIGDIFRVSTTAEEKALREEREKSMVILTDAFKEVTDRDKLTLAELINVVVHKDSIIVAIASVYYAGRAVGLPNEAFVEVANMLKDAILKYNKESTEKSLDDMILKLRRTESEQDSEDEEKTMREKLEDIDRAMSKVPVDRKENKTYDLLLGKLK